MCFLESPLEDRPLTITASFVYFPLVVFKQIIRHIDFVFGRHIE